MARTFASRLSPVTQIFAAAETSIFPGTARLARIQSGESFGTGSFPWRNETVYTKIGEQPSAPHCQWSLKMIIRYDVFLI